jgi:hypothetical protein
MKPFFFIKVEKMWRLVLFLFVFSFSFGQVVSAQVRGLRHRMNQTEMNNLKAFVDEIVQGPML